MTKGNLILLSIVLVLILVIAFGIGWLVVASNQDDNQGSTVEKPKYDIKKSKMYEVSSEAIVSNLSMGDGRTKAVVRVKPQIRLADDKILKEFQARSPEIVDAFITVLRSKTLEEMQQNDSKEIIKQELINRLSKSFNTDKILDVFFEEFIVQ